MRLFGKNDGKINMKEYILSIILCLVMFAGIGVFVFMLYQRASAYLTISEVQHIAWNESESPGEGEDEIISNGFRIVSGDGIEANKAIALDDSVGKEVITVEWEKPESRKIDFDALKAVNPDICGWIRITGTPINYPILKATEGQDEDYYLAKNYKGKADAHGSIYIRSGDDGSFTGFDTVLYGHNMKDGTMFADIHKFTDPEYSNTRSMVYIYKPDGTVIKGHLMACYETDSELLSHKFNDFQMESDRERYLSSFENTTEFFGKVRNSIERKRTRLITLSTCCSDDDRRMLLQFAVFS